MTAPERPYWFGVGLLFSFLLVGALLPFPLGLVLLCMALYSGSWVVDGRWEVPGLSPWLRGSVHNPEDFG